MAVRRYVASGRADAMAIPAVLGGSLAAGIAAGVAEGVVSRWFSLFLVFPLLLGLLAGGGAAAMVGKFKLRVPAIALICGLLGGGAGYVAEHVTAYVEFRSRIAESIVNQHPETSEAELGTMLDQLLVHEVGASGFVGYLQLAARTGVNVKSTHSYDKDGITFSGKAAWGLWAVELVSAAGLAGWLAAARAKQPFCEECNAWYGARVAFGSRGRDSRASLKQLRAAFAADDLDGAARAFSLPPEPKRALQLTARSCPGCGSDAFVELNRAARGTLLRPFDGWLMSKAELARFQAALRQPSTAPDAPFGHPL